MSPFFNGNNDDPDDDADDDPDDDADDDPDDDADDDTASLIEFTTLVFLFFLIQR
ncbi:MAG: hypothetical protein J5642_02575 [Bacteroidales bacterium]|nr:hypothetical protein [Bacteroidales bacterium]